MLCINQSSNQIIFHSYTLEEEDGARCLSLQKKEVKLDFFILQKYNGFNKTAISESALFIVSKHLKLKMRPGQFLQARRLAKFTHSRRVRHPVVAHSPLSMPHDINIL